MSELKGKERTDRLIKILRSWQALEEESIKNTQEIITKTKSPIIAMFMTIINQDSAMHRKLQELVIESLTESAISITPEDIAEMSEALEKHDKIEHETIKKAEEALQYCPHWVQREILEYLIEDEQKHEKMLRRLNAFKRKLYPY